MLVALAAPLTLGACIVDSDNRCGAHQHESEEGFVGCVCDPGATVNADKSGCAPCADHEEVVQGACACQTGFARPAAGAACVASQQGAACSSSAGCSADFPLCAPQGYCTKSPCTSDADCALGGYACETSASPAYCSRPPAGQGKTCSSAADCAGLEASACTGGSCLVSGCKTTTRCHGSWACCDFSAFGMADVCVPDTGLIDGKCPGTMADPVTR
ncbi:MAG TPA: hypothetical protein VFX59_27025 [Polyangiales bacterium]|nr:hypothetical protein [Polyangiales bacterium]